jgi:hypothetical protein
LTIPVRVSTTRRPRELVEVEEVVVVDAVTAAGLVELGRQLPGGQLDARATSSTMRGSAGLTTVMVLGAPEVVGARSCPRYPGLARTSAVVSSTSPLPTRCPNRCHAGWSPKVPLTWTPSAKHRVPLPLEPSIGLPPHSLNSAIFPPLCPTSLPSASPSSASPTAAPVPRP